MKNHIFLPFFLFSLFFAACEIKPDDGPGLGDCPEVSFDSGIIVQELDFNYCNTSKILENYTIEDSSAYQDLIAEFTQSDFCDSSAFPGIDFSKYSLLGLWIDGGGCSVNYFRTAADIPDSKKYLYTVTMQQCGMCEMYAYSYNWVLVPKLPSDYSVEFVAKYLNP